MPTGYGAIFNDGVKYLKINKFDTNGTDKSDYLAQMTSIRINHPDIGVKQYNIATTQVQNDYFIFGLTSPQPFTSSLGDINDYSFLATSASSFIPLNSEDVTYESIKISSFGSVSGNTLGFFTASNGNYTLGQTPNKYIQVQISGSYTYVASAGTDMYVGAGLPTAAVQNGNGVGQSFNVINLSVGTNTFNTTLFLTGSGIGLIENNTINFIIAKGPNSTNLIINSCHVSLSLYNATPFNSPSSLILYDPDSINFDYNDYNPLLDNAETPQYSTTWMDVDYSQNPLTPINFGLIISGTADRAFVQDSNYSSKAWSNIRYNGSRTTSYRINQ
jgi:hypothetical protein